MEHHSLNMQLPRGWYQVAGVTPHTFRRHCLSSKSGSLQLSLLEPESSSIDGEQCLELLRETLVRQDIRVGQPLKTGHEACAAGIMAYSVYKHIGGQREYWLIPHEEASVFACWEMGAMATAGMERHDIHEMLKALHFEHEEDEAEPEAEPSPEFAPVAEESSDAEPHLEGDVFVIIDDVESKVEAPHQHENTEHGG